MSIPSLVPTPITQRRASPEHQSSRRPTRIAAKKNLAVAPPRSRRRNTNHRAELSDAEVMTDSALSSYEEEELSSPEDGSESDNDPASRSSRKEDGPVQELQDPERFHLDKCHSCWEAKQACFRNKGPRCVHCTMNSTRCNASRQVPRYKEPTVAELYKRLQAEAIRDAGGKWRPVPTDPRNWVTGEKTTAAYDALYRKYGLVKPTDVRVGKAGLVTTPNVRAAETDLVAAQSGVPARERARSHPRKRQRSEGHGPTRRRTAVSPSSASSSQSFSPTPEPPRETRAAVEMESTPDGPSPAVQQLLKEQSDRLTAQFQVELEDVRQSFAIGNASLHCQYTEMLRTALQDTLRQTLPTLLANNCFLPFSLAELGTFDGTPNELPKFLRNLRNLIGKSPNRTACLQLVSAIPRCLRKTAEHWFNAQSIAFKKEQLKDLDDWERELTKVFKPDWNQLRSNAEARAWDEAGETITDYYYDKIAQLDLVCPEQTAEDFVLAIVAGLPARFALLIQQPDQSWPSSADLLSTLQRQEARWRNAKP